MTHLIIPGDGSPIDNINFMRDNADDIVENYCYQRVLTEEELEAEKETFTKASIRHQQLLEEKERITSEINGRIKVEKELAKKSLNLIRAGRMEVSETVYLIKDEGEGRVGTFNQDGYLITDRPLKASERQRSMFSSPNLTYRTGTDNG